MLAPTTVYLYFYVALHHSMLTSWDLLYFLRLPILNALASYYLQIFHGLLDLTVAFCPIPLAILGPTLHLP